MNLFHENKPFWKGNLHCHTTLSDGLLSPSAVKAFYRQKGYDFLAITDHRILSEPAHIEDGLLLLPGLEMDFMLPGEALHIVGIGMSSKLDRYDLSASPQFCINRMRHCGGRAIVAHPAWSLNTVATLSALTDVTAAEIYNSVSTCPWNGDRADSSGVLDVCATHGTLFNLVASDDSHFYNGEAGYSATMIQADELTQQGLLSAMDEGRFYGTQGPAFEQITVEKGLLTVTCSPVDTIVFYSNLVWSAERCQTGKALTHASYPLQTSRGETFVRVQLIDENGKSAWSNPILLK
ncbi:MAG: hypothetical protein RSE58_00115 [Clostridia bacterium]